MSLPNSSGMTKLLRQLKTNTNGLYVVLEASPLLWGLTHLAAGQGFDETDTDFCFMGSHRACDQWILDQGMPEQYQIISHKVWAESYYEDRWS